MIRKLNRWQAIGLAAILIVCALAITGAVCHAETLTMLPAHTPWRAPEPADPNPAWFGLIVTIGAIIFLWSVADISPVLFL